MEIDRVQEALMQPSAGQQDQAAAARVQELELQLQGLQVGQPCAQTQYILICTH